MQWDNQSGNAYQIVLSSVPGFEVAVSSFVQAVLDQNATSHLSLQPNTSYSYRIKVSTDPDSEALAISTYTPSVSPGVTGFQVHSTTVSFFISPGANNTIGITGSTVSLRLAVSTGDAGDFSVTLSSSGQAETGLTTLTISGLTPNTGYPFQLRSVSFNNLSSSATIVTAATTTLAAIPSTVTFQSVSCSSIAFSWDRNGNPLPAQTSYQIQVSTWSEFTGTVVSSDSFAVSGGTTGLVPNQAYYFRVAAYHQSGGMSSFGETVSTMTRTTGTVLSPFFTAVEASSVGVQWFFVTGVSYVAALSTDPYFNVTESSGMVLAQATTDYAGLTPYERYYFRVKISTEPDQAYSSSISTLTIATGSALSPSYASVTPSSVTIQWSSVSGVDYVAAFSTTSDFSVTLSSGLLSATTTGYTGLAANTTHFFKVKVSTEFDGAYSETISTLTYAHAPGKVGLEVWMSSISVHLALGQNKAGTRLEVTTGSFQVGNTSAGVSSSLTLTDLSTNTLYTLYMRAVDDLQRASSFSFVATTFTLPAVPGTISFPGIGETVIQVEWEANGNPLTLPTSYQIQISSGDVSFASFSSSTTYTLQVTTGGLAPNTTYYFRVFAFGGGGSSSTYSGPVSTMTLPLAASPPGGPIGLTIPSISSTSFMIGWDDVSLNEDGFRILNSTDGLYGTVLLNTTFYVVEGLSPNLPINVRVASYNSFGASSSAVTITSHTLANPPLSPVFSGLSSNEVTLSWSANSNSTFTLYEVSYTSHAAGSFGIETATPVPFLTNLILTSTTVRGLSPGGSYYFRVRAANGDLVPSSFTVSAATQTWLRIVDVSTGGVLSAGKTTLLADPGVWITHTFLLDGTTWQTFTATETALTVEYGNGIGLDLPLNIEVNALANPESVVVRSTGAVPLETSGVKMFASSGTYSLQFASAVLRVSLASSTPQDVRVTMPLSGTRTVVVSLEPPSGVIQFSIPPGAFLEEIDFRFRTLSSFPSPSGAPSLLHGAPAALEGLGIGLEVTLNKALQPFELVPMKIGYRDGDLSGKDPKLLLIARYEESVRKWVLLETDLDLSRREAYASTDHFSLFQLMIFSPATDVSGARVYPNPLQPYLGHKRMTFINLSAYSTVRIFTLFGESVKEVSADQRGIAYWDGRNGSDEKVASGVYIALVEGSDGSSKKFKIAVEK